MNIETLFKELTDLDSCWQVVKHCNGFACFHNERMWFPGDTVEDAVRKAWLFVFQELGADEYRRIYLFLS